ncbi:MAG: apurinic endonuclease, APN1 [halophilic archaeon J07HX5]|jgi:Endonuclease IV (EC 3.1.21.-)|nr:MAG: apurinic endonuclease, APN1 [halophilic archaeon J07HX5]
MRVGAHVSIAGGVDNAVDRQQAVGGSCGQIFTTSPQVWREPTLTDEEVSRFRTDATEAGIGPWVVHASYLVNLATPKDDLREKSIASLQADVDAAARLGIEYVNVHLGAHTGAGVEQGLTNAASALDALEIPADVQLLVETDAGGGTKLGDEFSQFETVLTRSDQELGVCLDTAHVFAAGYDLATPDGVAATLAAFDDTIGLEALAYVHLNDSKHARGTHKDEHAHIGEGEIGESGMQAFLTHDAIRDLPVVLETPNEDDRGFEWNIDQTQLLADTTV